MSTGLLTYYAWGYRRCLIFGLCVALFTFLLAGLVDDMGQSVTVVVYAAIVYITLLGFIGFRRARSITKVDLFVVRWGFVLLYLLGMFLYPLIWHVRGVG